MTPTKQSPPGGDPSGDQRTNDSSAELTAPHRHALYGALHRRREASWRLPVLACGCSDPWPCRCSDPPPSAKMLDAATDAAGHLLACGLEPLFDVDTLRRLWRRGGSDRQLAERLHRRCGGPR
jgi:hypothetical protein